MLRERALERERERERELREAERDPYDDSWAMPSIVFCDEDCEGPSDAREPFFDDYEVVASMH